MIRPAIGTLNVWFTEAQTERYSPEEFIWVTLLPQNTHWGVKGRGNYSASRDYDILQQTGLTILDTVFYFLQHGDYKADWAYFNRHMRSSSGGPRTNFRTISPSTVLYIEDGVELIHRVISEHLQLVTQHALRVSGRHKHSTLALMCQRNPGHSQRHFLRHKLQMYCLWTMTFAEKPATHSLTLGINHCLCFLKRR